MGVVVNFIKHRITNLNKNFLLLIDGETGGGKSYTALMLALMVDPTFNIDRVVFTADEFMNLINSKTLKKGMAVVWDECGIGMYSRNWYSVQNKLINYVLQSFRRDNLFVIFTTPDASMVDSHARLLYHAKYEVKRIDYSAKQVIGKFLRMQYSSRYRKMFYKYLEKQNEDGTIITLRKIRVDHPPKDLVKEYEKKKKKFTEKLKEEAFVELSEMRQNAEKKKATLSDDDIIKQIKKNKKRYLTERKKINTDLISGEFKIGRVRAAKIRALIEAN